MRQQALRKDLDLEEEAGTRRRANVLCPVDFSALSQRSLRLAIEMCRRIGGKLILEHNLEGAPPSGLGVGWMWSEEHGSKARDQAAEAVARLQQLFEEVPEEIEYEAKITRGPIDDGILYLARELPASMIVIGTHGPSDAAHRSLTERLIIRSPCPVLTTGEGYLPESVFGVDDGRKPEDLAVVIPVDFSPRSRACVQYGLAMARAMPHHFHLVHVAPADGAGDTEASARLERRLQDLVPEPLAGRISTQLVHGDPIPSILQVARETRALFILMPAHGRSPLKRFLFGTTTLGVLHGSDCPVYFLPPKASTGLGFGRS